MNLLVHYRSEKYFSKPNAFKPERWIKNSGETASVDSYLLLPFGIRARTCTGRILNISKTNIQFLLFNFLI